MKHIYHITYEKLDNPTIPESTRVLASDYIEAINIFRNKMPGTKIEGIMQLTLKPNQILGKILTND